MFRGMNPTLTNIPVWGLGLRPAERCPLTMAMNSSPPPLARIKAINFTFDIAINEPGPLQCEPIIPKLTQLSDAVEALIDAVATVD